MSWGLELWDRVDAVIGQLTEDTDELASVFTRCIFDVMVIVMVELVMVMNM